MNELIRCDIYEIIFPDWQKLDEDIKEHIWQTLQQWTEFVGGLNSRKGFASARRQGSLIVGFYLEESLRTGLKGGKTPDTLQPNTDPNFEKLFFAIVLDTGFVIIQRRRLAGYVSMNYTSMFRGFEDLLTLLLQRSGLNIERIRLAKFFRKRDQSEMLQIFMESTSVEIEIHELHNRIVPENLQLSNPDPSEEILLHRIFNRDFEKIEQEIFKAAPNQDLRKTKSAKAAANTGKIQRVVTKTSSGKLDTVLVEQDEKIQLPIDDSKQTISQDEFTNTIEIIERRIRIPVPRGATVTELSALGPLFSLSGSQDE